jgi:nucleotide-binding universal stress UspA family protein
MRVLIATDGSQCSQKAIEECCRMFAKAKDIEIKIVSTYEGTIPLDAFGIAAQNAEKNNLALHQRAEQVVSDARNFISRRIPNARIQTLVAMDIAERFVIHDAKEWKANLIVVGSHGRNFWGRLTLGSVSDAIIHHAPCSVMVARQKW